MQDYESLIVQGNICLADCTGLALQLYALCLERIGCLVSVLCSAGAVQLVAV